MTICLALRLLRESLQLRNLCAVLSVKWHIVYLLYLVSSVYVLSIVVYFEVEMAALMASRGAFAARTAAPVKCLATMRSSMTSRAIMPMAPRTTQPCSFLGGKPYAVAGNESALCREYNIVS